MCIAHTYIFDLHTLLEQLIFILRVVKKQKRETHKYVHK